jgi:hypothetical protein
MAFSSEFWKETLQEIGMWPEDRPAFMNRKQRARVSRSIGDGYDERGTRRAHGAGTAPKPPSRRRRR